MPASLALAQSHMDRTNADVFYVVVVVAVVGVVLFVWRMYANSRPLTVRRNGRPRKYR
jgi:hypothetical protein